MQDSLKAVWSIPDVSVAFFPSLKQNLIANSSSKVSSRPDCHFEIHQLWQSGFSRVYSNCWCSCLFKPEIIKIGRLSHKIYSNNILNVQESTPILNACTKKVWKLIEFTTYTHTHTHTQTYIFRLELVDEVTIYICIYIYIYIYIYIFGNFIHQFQSVTKTLIRKLERILIELYRQNVSLSLTKTHLNERLLNKNPYVTHTHTHTHTHIYIYIYIYICACVCVCVCVLGVDR